MQSILLCMLSFIYCTGCYNNQQNIDLSLLLKAGICYLLPMLPFSLYHKTELTIIQILFSEAKQRGRYLQVNRNNY